MKVEVGKHAGFCGGVNLCVKTLINETKSNEQIYCLGEIVHNNDVIMDFKNRGVVFVNTIDEVPNGSRVVIRAHGETKELYNIAKKRKMRLLDLTCPKVAKIREVISEYINKEDTFIILIAKKDHPEAKSTISFAGKYSVTLENIDDINNILDNIRTFKNIIIISQTTFNEKTFLEYANYIKENVSCNTNIIIKNTICNATSIRQEETRKMSKEKECMLVVGGKNSSNTKKLFDIAKSNCNNTYFIENKHELSLDKLVGFNNIGIMAGASTPESVVSEIVNEISKL